MNKMTDGLTGKVCMVRTYSAGVFYGEIVSMSDDGKQAVIKNSRQVWYWDGAATLSQLATEGTTAPQNCKFPVAVVERYVTEVIEVLPMTDKAIASLNAVKEWKR